MKGKKPKETVVKGKVKRKRFLTFSKKLVALCQIPMLVLCVVITVYSARALQTGIEGEIEKSLQIVAASVNETYTNLYEGDYKKGQSGRVTKGDATISGDTQLIDGLKEKTGFEVSLFFDNMRLITTIQNENGSRVNGTGIASEQYAQIREGQVLFLKDSEISGREYYVYYQPLVNSDGSVIGAVEAAMEASAVRELIDGQILQMVVFSLVFVVIAAVLVMVLSRRMVSAMQKIKGYLVRIMKGELDAQPDARLLQKKDELGDIYRICVRLRQALYDIVNNIKESTDNLVLSADKLTDMAQTTQSAVGGVLGAVGEIASGAKTQAEGTAEANDNVIKIGEQIAKITEEVDSLAGYAGQMNQAEKESEKNINELSAYNADTRDFVQGAAEQITAMNKSVQSINAAVGMIRSIAEETDLLSLNASIEAARAGESGRGFGVVAEQICRLADQSNSSAREIEQMVEEILKTSQRMVEIMGQVTSSMERQQEKLEDTKKQYAAVSRGVENSFTHIEGIKKSIDELGGFGAAIRTAVGGLAQISGQTASFAGDTMETVQGVSDTMGGLEASSKELTGLADQLKENLVIFRM